MTNILTHCSSVLQRRSPQRSQRAEKRMCVQIQAQPLFLEPKLQDAPDKDKIYAVTRCNSAYKGRAQWQLCHCMHEIQILRLYWCVMEEFQLENTGLHAAMAQVPSLEQRLLFIYRHKSNSGTKYTWQLCPGVCRTAPTGQWGCDHHLSLCSSMYHQFCCRIEGFSTTNAVHHARGLLPFTSLKYTSGIRASLVLSNLKHLKRIEIWILIFCSSCRTCLGDRGVKVQQGGKESSIQGKMFVYLVEYDLMPSVMYPKISGNQSGRNYKTGIYNCSWIPCIQAASLNSGSVIALWPAAVTQLLQRQKDESGLWLLLREIFPVLCQFQEQQRRYLLHTPHKIQYNPWLEASSSWENFNKQQRSRHDPSSLSRPKENAAGSKEVWTPGSLHI